MVDFEKKSVSQNSLCISQITGKAVLAPMTLRFIFCDDHRSPLLRTYVRPLVGLFYLFWTSDDSSVLVSGYFWFILDAIQVCTTSILLSVANKTAINIDIHSPVLQPKYQKHCSYWNIRKKENRKVIAPLTLTIVKYQ